MLHRDKVLPVSSNYLLENWISARYRKVSELFFCPENCCCAFKCKNDVILIHVTDYFYFGTEIVRCEMTNAGLWRKITPQYKNPSS